MAEISIELRLVLDKLRKDIQQAAAEMKAGLSVNIGDTAKGTERAAKAMDDLEKKTRKATSAMKDQKAAALDAWRKSLPAPQVFGPGFTPSPKQDYSGYGPTMNPPGGLGPVPGSLASRPGYSGPVPPMLVPPVIQQGFFQRLMAQMQGGGATSAVGSIAGRFGLSGMGTIMRAGEVGLVVAGVAASLLALKKVVNEVSQAFENARKLYAKSLMSGAGLGFTTYRSQLASVIGVSEQEVLKFGGAVEYLNDKLAFSTKTLVETTPELTATNWEFRALGENIKALFAVIGEKAAPALREFAAAMSVVVKVVTTMIKDNPQFWLLANIARFGSGALGMMGDKGAAPAPTASANRMATSAWERMGLVLGNAGRGDYEKQTAANTRRLVALTEKLVSSNRYFNGGGLMQTLPMNP